MPVWRRFLRNRTAVFGALVVTLFVLGALFAPWIAPHDPNQNNLAFRLHLPSAAHLLGNDELGRDILSRLLWGARTSLTIGVGSVAVAVTLGVPTGLIAGYYGGAIDAMISGAAEVLMAFPGILLALGVVAIFGFGTGKLIIAVGIYSVPTLARLVRASTMSARSREYVEAARAMGQGDLRIMFRHLLPNVATPIIVETTLRLATNVLTAATLSFLGLGIQPPNPEWGSMVASASKYLLDSPHAALIPGFALMLIVLGFNLAGDGLRDALDPTLKDAG